MIICSYHAGRIRCKNESFHFYKVIDQFGMFELDKEFYIERCSDHSHTITNWYDSVPITRDEFIVGSVMET